MRVSEYLSQLLFTQMHYHLSIKMFPLISASISERPPSRSPTDCAAPDIDAECLHTLQSLVDHYAPSHPLAEQLLTSHANLDWLARDLVYGSSLPDERVSFPLLYFYPVSRKTEADFKS